jgi:hypothetical protein
MEYVYNGKIVTSNMLEIDGITYPRQAYASLPGVIPVRPVPTIDNATQRIDPAEGHLVDGEWVMFNIHTKTADELEVEFLEAEKLWVDSEMVQASIEIGNHEDGGVRAKNSLPEWRAYRNELRNYIVSNVVLGARPTRPV